MDVVAPPLAHARAARIRPGVVVALLCVAAAAAYAWMRLGAADGEWAQLHGWCDRVELAPTDWYCLVGLGRVRASFLGGSLLVGLGLALPGAILAASGRRWSALVPVALGGAATAIGVAAALPGRGGPGQALFGISETLTGGGASSGYWANHPLAAVLLDLALVGAPALAVAFVLRPPARPRPEPLPAHARWVATAAVVGAVVAVRMLWGAVPQRWFLGAGPAKGWVPVGVMVVFGAMLGPDRKWWPWSLAPVAVLLSLGPTMALLSIPVRMVALTWFAGVVPLFLAGLVGSAWRPLATRLARRRRASRPAAPDRRRRVRPTVALNALAAAVLVVSVIAQRADPLPVQISMSLPTFLGARELANDVRAKTNLALAADALDAHRSAGGTYRGSDAELGEAAAPALAWSDGVPAEDLVVGLVASSRASATLVARSESGAAFCVTTSIAGRTLGVGDGVREARAACASAAFTSADLATLDLGPICAQVDEAAVLLCRSVQRLTEEILATPALPS
jgi:hypothetical protein